MQIQPSCPWARNEEHKRLATLNNNDQSYSDDVRVHRLVSRQADATPQALALAACTATLTYGELERRSNRLAHHLLSLGVGPDVLVGLCVERSPMMAVGALAILKAGGAYVPLDPSYPQERIAFILKDAAPRVVIAQANVRQRVAGDGREIVLLDPEPQEIAAQSSSMPGDLGNADSLAYVIYTSGSTGQPKGVQSTHRGLLNLTWWHQSGC